MKTFEFRTTKSWLTFGSTLSSFLLPICFLAPAPVLAGQHLSAPPPKDEWAGIYISGKKAGYSHIKVEPITFEGKPALRETSHSVIHILLLGQTMEEDEDSVSVTDLASHPVTQELNVSSNGSKMHVTAQYDYVSRVVNCTLTSGSDKSTKKVPMPVGADLVSDVDFVTVGKALKVGQKFEIYSLDPSTISLEKIGIDITGTETIRDEYGAPVASFVTKEKLPVGESTMWLNANGDTVRGELSVGPVSMVLTAESRIHALDINFISPGVAGKGGAGIALSPDLAVATSVLANKKVSEPRQLKELNAIVSGIPDSKLVLSDDRQKATSVSGTAPPITVNLHITAESLPGRPAALPISDAALAPYLRKAPYLNVDDDALRKIALEVKGGETDSLKVALALRNWVSQNMTPDASIGVPRSASEVCARRRGVCRDYATLYTALARISGVPTRICSGVVYADLGGRSAFFYHAWAESYVGKWVAVDPTLYTSAGVDYVDATHIKFAQGDVTDMFEAIEVVGKIRITIQ